MYVSSEANLVVKLQEVILMGVVSVKFIQYY
jgi:hypothetical protein